MDANADVKAGVAVGGLDFGARSLAEFEQSQATAHRALGVVLGAFVRAEHCKQVVAGVLEDLAPVAFHDRGSPRQKSVQHRTDLLGVQMGAQCGGADRVEKEDADVPYRLRRFRCQTRAQRGKLRAQAADGGINHRITQRCPLCLQRLNAGFELLPFGHRAEDSNRWW